MGDLLSNQLAEVKNSLRRVSGGDRFADYIKIVKKFLYGKISKDEFDVRCQDVIPSDNIPLHNDFIISLLKKVGAFESDSRFYDVPPPKSFSGDLVSQAMHNTSRKRKYNQVRPSCLGANLESFENADALDYVPEDSLQLIRQPTHCDNILQQNAPILTTLAKEVFLPESGMLSARMLIGAWEEGLLAVDDNITEYLITAVQLLIRNILSAVIKRRKSYRVTGGATFFYDLGAPLHDPMIINTITRNKIDNIPMELDKEITSANYCRRACDDIVSLSACEQVEPSDNWTITLKDCVYALEDRSVISSNRIRSINIQRIVMKQK